MSRASCGDMEGEEMMHPDLRLVLVVMMFAINLLISNLLSAGAIIVGQSARILAWFRLDRTEAVDTAITFALVDLCTDQVLVLDVAKSVTAAVFMMAVITLGISLRALRR